MYDQNVNSKFINTDTTISGAINVNIQDSKISVERLCLLKLHFPRNAKMEFETVVSGY